MSRFPIFLFLVATLCLGGIASAQIVPRGDLHCNDALGNPAPPYGVGTPVEISGIVTAGTGIFASYTSVHVQDETGAISRRRAGDLRGWRFHHRIRDDRLL